MTTKDILCNCIRHKGRCDQDAQFDDGKCAWCSHRWHNIHPLRRMFEKSWWYLFHFQLYKSHSANFITTKQKEGLKE